MTTELGTELGTILGTFIGSMETDGSVRFDASKLYALGSTGSYATPTGGGEPGVASGFGHILLYFLGPPKGTERILGKFVSGGYTIDRSGTLLSATWWATDGGGTQRSIAGTYPASFTDSVVPILLRHTGSAIDIQWGHTTQPRPSLAITGYTPSTGALTASAQTTANAARNGLMAGLSYTGTPSDAQVQAVLDAARTLGNIPSKAAAEALMPGTTVTHRWSLRDALANAGVPVSNGAAAPATIPDSVTLATVDALARVSSPVVHVIDPGAYPRTSYGALGFADAAYLEAAQGLRGAATGFTLVLHLRTDANAGGTQYIVSNYIASPASGFSVYATSGAINIYRAVGADLAISAANTNNIGASRLLTVTWDGTTWRTYDNGVAGATSTHGMTYGAGPMRIGATPATTTGAGATTVFAAYGCDSALSVGEIAAMQTSFAATGSLVPPSGKPNAKRWDLTQDVVANGGPSAGMPAQVLDRIGTDHLTRVGTGLQVGQRTERLWSYETTPIVQGASGLDLSNFFDCPTPLGEGASSFWGAAFFTVTSQAVASKGRVLLGSASTAPSNISGFTIATTGTNTFASMTAYNGLGAGIVSPSGVIAAADVGKLVLMVGVLDVAALKVRIYWKRVEVSTGTTYSVYSPSSSGLRLGRTHLANDYSPDGINLWGVSAGIGLPTLAQIQALYDQVQASERIGAIPGMTSLRVDLTQDALGNDNVLPASLTDRQSGTFNFTRTGAVGTAAGYARAFGW